MLLGASSKAQNTEAQLESVTSSDIDPGIVHGDWLRKLSEAAINSDWLGLGEMRASAEAAMGTQEVADALTVAAAFNGITRVADATGIPLDENTAATTQEMRERTGIAEFDYRAKSQRYA